MRWYKENCSISALDPKLLKQNEVEVNIQHQKFLAYVFLFMLAGAFFVLLSGDAIYLKFNIHDFGFLLFSFLTIRYLGTIVTEESDKYKYVLFAWGYILLVIECVLSPDYFLITLAIPLIMSSRYYNMKMVITTSIVTQVSVVIAGLGIVFVQPALGFARASSIVLPEGITLAGDGRALNVMVAELLNSGQLSRAQYFHRIYFHQLIYMHIMFVILSLLCMMNTMQEIRVLRRQTEIMKEEEIREQELVESRYRLSISQLQPHFVFNVLNSVYELCEINAAQAQEMILSFSKFLRHDIDTMASGKPVIFNKEINSVKEYLKLEQMRFGDRLNVEMNIKESNFFILPLTLQPLVENAVKHGICQRPEGGTIRISSYKAEQGYRILVEDDGVGFDINQKLSTDRTHIGINNVKTRVEQQMKGTFQLDSEVGRGTRIMITIPGENI